MCQEKKGKESEDIDSAREAVEVGGPHRKVGEFARDVIENHVNDKIKVK